MILFSHPTGNANVRHAALALQKAGLLGEFWTTVDHRPNTLFAKVLPSSLRTQLARRSYPAELHPYLHGMPTRELLRMMAGRLGLQSLVRHETGLLSVDSIYRALDKRVSTRLDCGGFSAVYSYEDGAAVTFPKAGSLGLRRLYDLPIGYWRAARRIMTEEAQRNPSWAMTIPGNADSAEKTARKDAELQQADLILVASTFTKNTLSEAPGPLAPVVVIPYGAPALPQGLSLGSRSPAGRLKALYVGSLGQRKGLSYLFEACRSVAKDVDLTVVGRLPDKDCPALNIELSRVRWIPSCPHSEVLRLMSEHDVFVFPSLFEGFGLVLLEAMAMGLPIITTPNTAGPDLLSSHGAEGYIVPIQCSSSIAEHLACLAADRSKLAVMSEAAKARAAQFTWQAYEDALASVVRPAIA